MHPEAQECQRTPEAGRGRRLPLTEPPQEVQLCPHLDFGVLSPQLGESMSVMLAMHLVVIVMATLGNKCSIYLTVNCTLSVPRMKVYMGMEIGVESMAQTRTYVYTCMCIDIQYVTPPKLMQ